MNGIQLPGPQITENGSFKPTEEILGKQPEALTGLVINKSLEKQAEMANAIRTDALHAAGKGQKLNISA